MFQINDCMSFVLCVRVDMFVEFLCRYLDLQLSQVTRTQVCGQEAAQEEEVSSSHWQTLLERSRTKAPLAVYQIKSGNKQTRLEQREIIVEKKRETNMAVNYTPFQESEEVDLLNLFFSLSFPSPQNPSQFLLLPLQLQIK